MLLHRVGLYTRSKELGQTYSSDSCKMIRTLQEQASVPFCTQTPPFILRTGRAKTITTRKWAFSVLANQGSEATAVSLLTLFLF